MNLLRQRLHQRAAFLAAIRAFFATRGVIEVDSEQLRAYGVTDPQLVPLAADGGYLQTSPEYALKILLAAGAGDIYQLAHVFRGEEQGRKHRREFMLLEWYRCGYDHLRLMDEVTDLVRTLLPACRDWPVRHTPYATLFRDRFAIDIHRADDATIRRLTTAHIPESAIWQLNRDAMLDLLYSHYIEPQLGRGALEYICDYPPSQAALARISENADGEAVAARFELYIDGMELCNGFWELTDAAEQRARFLADNHTRVQAGLPPIPLDEDFLTALAHGLPDCAGVALGVDRLLMLASDATHIEDVVPPSRL
ncbi:EF-P lysine aminoacylase EpmA [Cardiobacterium sp. Marseille-Q4385]|uniref:EF-P lysine aminoacylase EpmA n=1 Tax=Cardiobacterium sp. Marseille-Q4385 TaxID=2866573 RepID=UPI001CE44173|nr:EF-P lysine aminoacylase EpmA [Cardiobacterium sp. Marseille-Q4385]